MVEKKYVTLDGNEAVARVAYALNEVIAIYPITPASLMGEWADTWAAEGKKNLWGTVPHVVEMQSEAGAAGAVHGALQMGSLTTTFTASQGLLLMIPNMYKIAGELTAFVLHVAARAIAAQGLSIFGDHSDVMAVRGTGFALLSSASVQEAQDFAAIAHAATFESRIPFLHFFDGFRTSHEVAKILPLSQGDIQAFIDEAKITAHRERRLTPEAPVLRGTAQNPDVYFQARETVNPFYRALPAILQKAFDRFYGMTGRRYANIEYAGAPDAERVVVLMGSGAETVGETVEALTTSGEKVGLIKVRLYRPFDAEGFARLIPPTVKTVAVLDRCKEPGSGGEPLYLDCVEAIHRVAQVKPTVVGGRYGLSSKEFTPAMVKGIFDHLKCEKPRHGFTIGIDDDLSHTSLPYDPSYSVEKDDVYRAVFYGLGSDGTVGANKNSIKIIGEKTDLHAQGYFVYDSKKSGSATVSHLRFGPRPVRAPYLISEANFVACHQSQLLERFDVLKELKAGGTFLLNTPLGPDRISTGLPASLQRELIRKRVKFFAVDAYKVARECGMGGRINTAMQVCFFHLSGVLPREKALAEIKSAIQKSYAAKGEAVVAQNLKVVDETLSHLREISLADLSPALDKPNGKGRPGVPAYIQNVALPLMRGLGDTLPVSQFSPDGTFPTGTARFEKRNIAQEIPVWDSEVCIQCNKCALVCPHAVIRAKVYDPAQLAGKPSGFKSTPAKERDWAGLSYTLQVAPEDCTGCGLCVEVCPARNKSAAKFKAINMQPQPPLLTVERKNWDFFLSLPELPRDKIKAGNVRQQQVQEPLFEFSGACAGCGETPYLKLVSQLFGDRMVVANATGCSSIYGGNLPTTPWCKNGEGRGPAWSNSLFEDNAEFGLGFRVALDKQREMAAELLSSLSPALGEAAVTEIVGAPQRDEAEIHAQRGRVEALKARLQTIGSPVAARLLTLADALVKKSVWIVGGDGWAYDIGFGGLDHVMASGRDVNILVLDTEVYSNTGGQMSKSTPLGAVAKFAAAGKSAPKKDLGLIAMTYGNVYVARVAMGAKDEHTLKAFLEAERYPGPSLIIAYSHCIAHGIDMRLGLQQQKLAVDTGQWNLYRYNPELKAQGLNPFVLDSPPPKRPLKELYASENRFKMLSHSHPARAESLLGEAQRQVDERYKFYRFLSTNAAKAPGS